MQVAPGTITESERSRKFVYQTCWGQKAARHNYLWLQRNRKFFAFEDLEIYTALYRGEPDMERGSFILVSAGDLSEANDPHIAENEWRQIKFGDLDNPTGGNHENT